MKKREAMISVSQRLESNGIVNLLEMEFGSFGDRPLGKFGIEFRHVGVDDLTPVSLLDGYVFGVLPFVMRGVERLVVRGPVSQTVIRNSWALGEAWHAWLPDEYFPVEVVAEEICDEDSVLSHRSPSGRSRAVAAFSGGIDSTFTALRHVFDLPESVSYPLTDLCIVHGFDVRLDNSADFEGLLSRTHPLIASLGLPLHVIRTNLREVTQPNWEHAFGLHLACVLHQFAGDHAYGLIASGDAYHLRPPIAWGSSPATDHLMSGVNFQIVNDGGGFSRPEKVALLTQHPSAESSVKFCYESRMKDRNCGKCYKCIRTYLCFIGNGIDEPRCFDAPVQAQDVTSLLPTEWNTRASQELAGFLLFAEKTGSSDPLFSILQARITDLDQAILGQHGQLQELFNVQGDLPRHSPVFLGMKVDQQIDAASQELSVRMRDYGQAIRQFLANAGPVWLLSGLPGNVGDHLIWAGTEHLLNSQGIAFDRFLLETLDVYGSKMRGTLVVPGSGAMTRIWHGWLPDAIITAANRFDQILILPSEFEPDIPVVRRALTRPNVFAFARDATSYGRVKRFCRSALALDPALYAFEFLPWDGSAVTDEDLSGALVALRTDKGSTLAEHDLQPNAANDDISLTRPNLAEFLNAIREAPAVVSDRLHVAVAAVMLGKTVRFVDPYEAKISRYVQFNFRDSLQDQIQRRDEAWLVTHGYATMRLDVS